MNGSIKGECRTPRTLFPDQLDDYVTEENPARVIDVFIDDLDLNVLDFKTTPAATGRPAYHPDTMLKLFIYGYLNRIPVKLHQILTRILSIKTYLHRRTI